MATNDFLPFAESATNIESQADYLVDSNRPLGNVPGVASSKFNNKAIRQANAIASQLAQYVSNTLNEDVLDNGDMAALLAQITATFTTTYVPPVFASITATGSWTVPSPAPKAIEIRAVGAGGGGGGGGLSGATNGAAGGLTSFASPSFLNCPGGGGGGAAAANFGGTGGTAAGSASGTGFHTGFIGGDGQGGTAQSASLATNPAGGQGGASAFGGNGGGSNGSASSATPGKPFSGGGGGGGSGDGGGSVNASSGGGGQAGSYGEAFINAPTAGSIFSVTVGVGGAAGAAGANGAAGAAGANGGIYLKLIY